MKRTIQTLLWAAFMLMIPFTLVHDSLFAQVVLPEPFAITTPEDGDTWITGDRVTVAWRQTDFSVDDHRVDIKLIPDNNDLRERVVETVHTNEDRVTFTLPSFIKPGYYEIILVDVAEDPEYGEILDGWMEGRILVRDEETAIKFLEPRHGDEIEEGRRHVITWNTSGGIRDVGLSLYQSFRDTKSGTVERVKRLTTRTDNDGEFEWVIPDNLLLDRNPDNYIYHIYDAEDDFAEQKIVLPTHPSVSRFTPTLGDQSGASNWSGYFSIIENDKMNDDNPEEDDESEEDSDDEDEEQIGGGNGFISTPDLSLKDHDLVSALGSPRVYYIKNEYRMWIPTPEDFEQAGFDWNDILIITPEELSMYPRMTLVRKSTGGFTYYLTQGGLKRAMINDAVFRSYNNDRDDVITVSSRIVNAIDDVRYIHLDGSPNIYRISGTNKHWIYSQETFNRIAPLGTQVAPINKTEFTAYSTGAVIK